MSNIFDFDDDEASNSACIFDNISALKPQPLYVEALNPEQKEAVEA